ncbi:hypothetical protein FQA39_LY11344 [Lamprigera yunnana]|nr:hypothetical protein FQA39_LY11344 [Lamprigera yunnana]
MLSIFHGFLHGDHEPEYNTRCAFILQRRLLQDNSNPFNLPNNLFIELFRFDKNLAQELIARLTPHLQHPVRITGISVEVLAALRFYSTGCYQRRIGQNFDFGLIQTIVHRVIHEVTHAIDATLADQFISFPNTPRKEYDKKGFYE